MAGIIATIGPATDDYTSIKALYGNSVRVLRFNFPHASYEQISRIQKIIDQIEQEEGGKFIMLGDTAGPGMRIGTLKKSLRYKQGEKFKLIVDKKYKDKLKTLWCSYPYLVQDVRLGMVIKIDSGLLDVKVLKKNKNSIEVEALNEAVIKSKAHVNLSRVHVRLNTLTDQDKVDLKFCIEANFQYIAMSFVRNAGDIQELREFLYNHNGAHLKIIAKIESQEGVENISEIIRYADAVMVARGDLGTEMPIETIPALQSYIIGKVKRKQKKVIVATQMLESMIYNRVPTRAEVSDVFHAVREGADFVMLSGETAVGAYPIESVKVMKRVICEAEKYI